MSKTVGFLGLAVGLVVFAAACEQAAPADDDDGGSGASTPGLMCTFDTVQPGITCGANEGMVCAGSTWCDACGVEVSVSCTCTNNEANTPQFVCEDCATSCPSTGSGGAGAGGMGGAGGDPLAGCDYVGIDLVQQQAGYFPFEQNRYTWLEASDPNNSGDPDFFITLNYARGANDQPHTYGFSPDDVAFSHTRISIQRNGRFLSVGGSMTVTQNGVGSGTLSGTLEDVRLIEVLYDGTQISPYTVKPNGLTWCIPSMSFSADITL